MQSPLSRRAFFKSAACGLATAAWHGSTLRSHAVDPFRRPGPARLSLSLAAYSFRDYFHVASHDRQTPAPPERRIDLLQFVDFCADHGCDGTELTSYYFPNDVTDSALLELRRHAFLRGVSVSGTAVGNTFTHAPGPRRDAEIALVKRWIDRAKILGAPHVRVFAGNKPDDATLAEAKSRCVEALDQCGDYAGRAGVFLGLENHGGIVAEAGDLLDIIGAVRSPWVGVNLDTGNFHTEDPYRDLERCAPYAVNVQIKSEMQPRRQRVQRADLSRLIRILREAHYQGFVALEYESPEDPWKAVPSLLNELRALIA
jgi:sugar phosphate isomerase/epimerase